MTVEFPVNTNRNTIAVVLATKLRRTKTKYIPKHKS